MPARASVTRYYTATVSCGCDLSFSPTFSTSGWGPAASPSGTTAFTCSTPKNNVGAPPAYWMSALMPPIVSDTGANGTGNGGSPEVRKFGGGGRFHNPAPVAKIWLTELAAAGFFAEFSVLSTFRVAPCPLPLPSCAKTGGVHSTSPQ